MSDTTYTSEEREAFELGKQAAANAASWATDGNQPDDHAARVLALMEDGNPLMDEYLPARPNLSGEWAGDLTPNALAAELGMEDADPEEIDALAEAFEAGVSEVFESECERVLRAAL